MSPKFFNKLTLFVNMKSSLPEPFYCSVLAICFREESKDICKWISRLESCLLLESTTKSTPLTKNSHKPSHTKSSATDLSSLHKKATFIFQLGQDLQFLYFFKNSSRLKEFKRRNHKILNILLSTVLIKFYLIIISIS